MKYYLLVFGLCLSVVVKGQGCSDAGFCTMGAMKPDQHYNKRINVQLRAVELNLYHGKSTLTPRINVATLDFTLSLNTRNFLQIKVPYQRAEGSLGRNEGLGDISLSYTRSIGSLAKGDINLTLGTKIPSGNATKEKSSSEYGPVGDLPMYYQVSLGSFDFIAGAAYIDRKWLIATGIQVAAFNINQNEFNWESWSEYPSEQYVRKYDRATHLRRGTDIMLRVERNFRWTNFNIYVGLLPIYRITKDQILESAESDVYVKVPKTTGMALTLLTGLGYNLDVKNSIKGTFGKKWTDRDVNPDGLTREHVISVSYVHRF